MIPEARKVHLLRKDRKVLEACCRSPVTLQRDLKRARIVLLAADGLAIVPFLLPCEGMRQAAFWIVAIKHLAANTTHHRVRDFRVSLSPRSRFARISARKSRSWR